MPNILGFLRWKIFLLTLVLAELIRCISAILLPVSYSRLKL